jgi:hypothetical protein
LGGGGVLPEKACQNLARMGSISMDEEVAEELLDFAGFKALQGAIVITDAQLAKETDS